MNNVRLQEATNRLEGNLKLEIFQIALKTILLMVCLITTTLARLILPDNSVSGYTQVLKNFLD